MPNLMFLGVMMLDVNLSHIEGSFQFVWYPVSKNLRKISIRLMFFLGRGVGQGALKGSFSKMLDG